MSSQNGETTETTTMPRAVIHKKILDAAQSHPEMSIGGLATAVNGASEDLIERVLDEYGDPAESDQAAAEQGHEPNEDQSTMSKTKTNGDISDGSTKQTHEIEQESAEVTEKQLEALRAIQEHPNATQKDLAERFDVTQSTINTRLNSIEEFEWEHRQEFVETMHDNNNALQDEATSTATSVRDKDTPSSVPVQDLMDQVDDLADQVETVEQRLTDHSTPTRSPFGDPDLASKIVRACMDDDDITEEEEVQILKKAITFTNPPE